MIKGITIIENDKPIKPRFRSPSISCYNRQLLKLKLSFIFKTKLPDRCLVEVKESELLLRITWDPRVWMALVWRSSVREEQPLRRIIKKSY